MVERPIDSFCRASILKDGFDLLMLDQEDYFFGGFPCSYSLPSHSMLQSHHLNSEDEGSVKICSLHLYLMSSSQKSSPVIRIPFASISSMQDDYKPSQVIFTLMGIRTCTLIPRIPAPYSTLSFYNDGEDDSEETFCFTLSTSADVAPVVRKLLQERLETAWSPGQGKRAEGTEKYVRLLHTIREFENEKKFVMQQQVTSKIILQCRAAQVSPLVVQPGWIALTQQFLYFQPYYSHEETRSWALSSVKSISRRRFKLKDEALEIFFTDAAISKGQVPSVYFTCFQDQKAKEKMEQIVRNYSLVPSTAADLRQSMKAWRAGAISNYEYLIRLNDAAGRSFNDLSHYPVFPWVIADYSSPSLDLAKASTFRDLSCSIASLNPRRVAQGREMYRESLKLASTRDHKSRGSRWRNSAGKQEAVSVRAWMFGSHYSNPGVVVHYLIRSHPRLMLRLFNGHFDVPSRMFTSISGAWQSVQHWDSDVKELIPQFYMPPSSSNACSDFLIAQNADKMASKDLLQDVVLPPWASSPADFLSKMSRALESDHVSSSLHAWIDLVFGVLSRGTKAAGANNLFHFLTYDTIASQMVDEEDDPVVKAAYQVQAEEFGQTPWQLFARKHPPRLQPSRQGRQSLFSRCLACTSSLKGETKED